MRARAEFAWDIRRVFVEKRLRTPIVRKSGRVVEKTKVPITLCRLFLTGDFVTTRVFRCVPVVRGRTLSWSISALIEPKKPLWEMPVLHPEAKTGPEWKRWASMSPTEFSEWLSRVLGEERANEAISGMNPS